MNLERASIRTRFALHGIMQVTTDYGTHVYFGSQGDGLIFQAIGLSYLTSITCRTKAGVEFCISSTAIGPMC
jgi:hypothetical protein